MIIKTDLIIVFDLDDTLYKEIDFLKSAFKDIADFLSKKTNKTAKLILAEMILAYQEKKNVFETVIFKNNIQGVVVNDLIKRYRNHKPNIYLTDSNKMLLDNIKQSVYKTGLITDGRCIQQQHKIEALGLNDYFDDIVISEAFGSEKPNINNFKYFVEKYGSSYKYVYVGDNTSKDFEAPNKLGWTSICLLDNGVNIHPQSFNTLPYKKPTFKIRSLTEIRDLLF